MSEDDFKSKLEGMSDSAFDMVWGRAVLIVEEAKRRGLLAPKSEDLFTNHLAEAAAAGADGAIKALPFEVKQVLAVYLSPHGWDGWDCEKCGGNYPKDIITACPQCSEAAVLLLGKPS